ncbi:MAG: response regulator, partial [Candidatus Omnitrophica bacterium]|nr:response regulator [Candidatus Omnitrophota bacterium]
MPKAEKYRILLVDDEDVIRDSVGTLLRENGFDVTTASGVDEALGIIKKEKEFNTVISDIKMPKKNGIELLKAVKEISEDIPVILLTGYADLETAQKAVTHGAYDYINKPVDEEKKLVEPLNRAIKMNQLAKDNKRLMAEILTMAEEHEQLINAL